MLFEEDKKENTMYKEISRLIVYTDKDRNSVLYEMGELFRMFDKKTVSAYDLREKAFGIVKRILEISTDYAFEDNLWHSYLTHYIIDSENSFSVTCERTGAGDVSINEIVKSDFRVFINLFNFDFTEIEEYLDTRCFSMLCSYRVISKPELMYNGNVSIRVKELKTRLEACRNEDEFFDAVSEFYRDYGAGIFGVNRAFRIKDGDELVFEPVKNMDNVMLDDLIGYETQKAKLLENTEAFIAGRPANNVLLFGDRGTGKSTSVKAIANQFWGDGLRMIQVYRHQMRQLSAVISKIRTRNYRFIIYMDDLSFEDFETEYKYLKAVIEGGLESKPENIIIYASSNRRHLIKETWSDRDDMEHTGEFHRSDSVEEKLSLSDRFGVQIYFGKPTNQEYIHIVEELAREAGIDMEPDKLRIAANAWQIRHGGTSGRCARQFVDNLAGRNNEEA